MSLSTSVHYYIQCVKHRGPEGFQRNAALNRTCRVNGLCVPVSLCVCVCWGSGRLVAWHTDRQISAVQLHPWYTRRQHLCQPSILPRCKPSPLIGPRGPCACVWGEVSIRVITLGSVRLTPTLPLRSPTGQKGFLHQPAPAPLSLILWLFTSPYNYCTDTAPAAISPSLLFVPHSSSTNHFSIVIPADKETPESLPVVGKVSR